MGGKAFSWTTSQRMTFALSPEDSLILVQAKHVDGVMTRRLTCETHAEYMELYIKVQSGKFAPFNLNRILC